MLRKLYEKVMHYSDHRFARPILCLIAFTEASFFPVPPDVLMVTMSVAQPKKALQYAFLVTIFSVLGGIAGYYIGFWLWDGLSDWFFRFVFSEIQFEKVRVLYAKNAFSAIFLSGYTPIPYKIFTISAGVFQISLQTFITASVLGRGLRFFLLGALIHHYGDRAKPWVERNLRKLIVFSSLFITVAFVLAKLYF